MPPKFKRHLNDEEVTGSIRSDSVHAITNTHTPHFNSCVAQPFREQFVLNDKQLPYIIIAVDKLRWKRN
uniref:Uncharacterized protein n=1 Tax=Sinocyclocheilus grahami TaxID=75366 RepID=A0A672PZA5_SINGR